MMLSSLFSALLLTVTITISTDSTDTVNLPTSCLGLPDGTYLMKLLQNDQYPIITVDCSNEYMIINPSTDTLWHSYFTSYTKYHYGVVAPLRNDNVNWDNWFIPSYQQSNNGKYLISLKCDICDSSSYLQKFNDKSAYYLSALAFGCFNPTRGWPSCDMDWNTYDCKLCHWNEEQSQIIWSNRDFRTLQEAEAIAELTGVCDFEIRQSTDEVLTTFSQCATYIPDENYNFKPSIGIDGRYCQCYKPDVDSMIIPKELTVTKDEYDEALERINDQQHDEELILNPLLKTAENDQQQKEESNIVHLTQDDFEKGTYRIQQSGTYIIDEDIIFNFNAKENDPLADDAWWPTEAQEIYPGAVQARGPYFLGFFAGITVETDDVVIDLNDHTLRMDEKFFFSQPFFSIIELASQPFLPQQGPGFFGSDPKFATNVVIKDGVLGLSSHHGIHGNYNKQIIISNVKIRNFQTHGIQLNGYEEVELSELEIGPTTNIAYLNGNYAHLRELLPTLRKMALKHSDETIMFNGRLREYTMNDLLDIVEPLMVKAYDYALLKSVNADTTMIENDDDFDDVHRLFINPSGLSYGAVTYGVFLNYPSAGIFGWHVNDAVSKKAVLTDVYIHDMYRKGDEIVGLSQRGRVYCNAFNGPLPLISMLGGIDKVREFSDSLYNDDDNENVVVAEYVGDIVSDLHIAMYEFGRDDFDNWPGIPYYGEHEGLLAWAKGDFADYLSSQNKDVTDVYCNNDAMFHPSKGLLGMKISGSTDVELNGITIENLVDYTDLGHDLCGKKDLYHFSQQYPYQIGFCMNMVHGISIDFSDIYVSDDINIDGIYSRTGLAFGLSTWFDTKITYDASIALTNIYAGYDIDNDESKLHYSSRPNKSPEACAIRIFSSDSYKVTNVFADEHNEKDNVRVKCINGNVGCFGNDHGVFTNLGELLHDDEIDADDVFYHTECNQLPPIMIDKNDQLINIKLLKETNKKKIFIVQEEEEAEEEDNKKSSSFYSSFDSSPIFFALISIFGVIILCVSKKIYRDYAWNKITKTDFEYKLINTSDQDQEAYGTFTDND